MNNDWADIPGFPGYFASVHGEIFSGWFPIKNGRKYNNEKIRALKPRPRKSDGYYTLTLINEDGNRVDVYVHQMVILAFIGPCPEGQEICHEDGDKSNNCLKNLRYDTGKANAADRIRHGTGTRGETHNTTKLTEEEVKTIRQRIAHGDSDTKIARSYSVSRGEIYNIRTRTAWGWLSE